MSLDRFFYFPDSKQRGSPADDGLTFEDVVIPTDDGLRLHGWFMPATGRARGTVLHLHGNAANITGHYAFVNWLPAAGYHVLAVDYRGYGRSAGRVSRGGMLLDALAAMDYLRGRTDVDRRRVFVFGQSIGGVVAAALAAKRGRQIAAVAIDSAFTSYRAIASYHVRRQPLLLLTAWWYPHFVQRGDDAIECVRAISPTPVLFMHGREDRITPARMSQELYDAAGEPKSLWLVDGLDHTEVWLARPAEARRRLIDHFESACAGTA
jgi:hypothetical protein